MWSKVRICLRVKCPLFLSYVNENRILSTVFFEKKNANIKFHENPSRGGEASCSMWTDGRT